MIKCSVLRNLRTKCYDLLRVKRSPEAEDIERRHTTTASSPGQARSDATTQWASLQLGQLQGNHHEGQDAEKAEVLPSEATASLPEGPVGQLTDKELKAILLLHSK